MSIEQSLERIADALERIAVESMKKTMGEPPQVTLAREAGIPVVEVTDAPAKPEPKKSDREILMEQLDALKLPYPAKASVKRLKEILETHGKNRPLAETKSETVTSLFPEGETGSPETKTPEKKGYTKAEAKEILMRYAAKFGLPKAMQAMADHKAKDLSEAEAQGTLQTLVEDVLKREANNGTK